MLVSESIGGVVNRHGKKLTPPCHPAKARMLLGQGKRQVRKCNRKLRRGERSHLKNTAPRFICGFQRYDKVFWKGIECFIFGKRTSGYFALRKLDGTKVSASAKASDITLLESAKTILTERMRIPLHPGLAA